MRASRLVNLLLLLQTRGQLTGAELAEQLEVSLRTVYRDVDALAEAGVPIYAERGPGGGVRLVDGYRTRLTGLNADEAEALFLSGLPGPAAELGLGTVVAAARLKVLAALPPELRSRASRINERFHLDAPGWFQPAEELPYLGRLATAVWESRRITIRYRRGERVESRPLDPLGLVLKGGTWYLVALSKGSPRTFRVSRIEDVRVEEALFERPRAFDLAGFWAASTAAYERDRPGVDVTLRVDPERLGALEAAVSATAMASATLVEEPDPAGWTRIRLRMESIEWAIGDLLPVGGGVEVLEPAEVRRGIVAAARAVIDQYGPRGEATLTSRPGGSRSATRS